MKYKAFISYRHSENGRRHAIALETALKRYAKPTLARPMKIFRDEKHMKPDISLPKLIQDGLGNSEYLIFLAEKASADSQWCGEELEYWCNPEKLNRTENLIIILIDDDIVLNEMRNINFEQTTALHPLLRPYLTSIPLYVDLRWAGTATDTDLQNARYRQEINALSARLKGVNPEDLNDEEIRVYRRNIRLRNGALLVLSLMLLTSVGTTILALDAQKKSQASAIEAKKQQQFAEASAAEARKNLADRIEQEKQKERLNFDKYVSNGDVYIGSFDYKFALREYQKADSILIKFPDDPKLLEKKEALLQKIQNATSRTKSQQ